MNNKKRFNVEIGSHSHSLNDYANKYYQRLNLLFSTLENEENKQMLQYVFNAWKNEAKGETYVTKYNAKKENLYEEWYLMSQLLDGMSKTISKINLLVEYGWKLQEKSKEKIN